MDFRLSHKSQPTSNIHYPVHERSVPRNPCHSELCHDAWASLIVQETCHSELERSGGEESRCLVRNEILRSAQDDRFLPQIVRAPYII